MSADGYLPPGCTDLDVDRASPGYADDEPEPHAAELMADELERRGISPVTDVDAIVDQLRADDDEIKSLREQLATADRVIGTLQRQVATAEAGEAIARNALGPVRRERDELRRERRALAAANDAVRDSVMAMLSAASAEGPEALAKVVDAILASGRVAKAVRP